MLAAYLRLYFNLIFLRVGPQAIPYSYVLAWLTLFLAFLVSLFEGTFIYDPLRNLAANLLDFALFLLFIYLVLRFTGKRSRFVQTLAAACGAITLLRLLSLPVHLAAAENLEQLSVVSALLILYFHLLLVYSLVVLAHIVRHAMSIRMGNAVWITLAYFFVNYLLLSELFPVRR